ncbi:MAG: hypothetical protein ACO3AD_18740 [Burkholderiaceae bacterium]
MSRERNLWRHIPLSKLGLNHRVVAALGRKGYVTAGDVIDATPEELAARVDNIGPVRAVKLRQTVIAQVCPPVVVTPASVPADVPILTKETLLGCIALLAFLSIMWAALVMVP